MFQVLQTRVSDDGGGIQEFYVHYDGLDRRLDEWVSSDRVDIHSKAPALTRKNSISTYDDIIDKADRKMTRFV